MVTSRLAAGEEEFEVIFHHAGAGDDGEVGGKLAVNFLLEQMVVSDDFAGMAHVVVDGFDFCMVVVAEDFEAGGGDEVGNAAVWGGYENFEVGDVFHKGGAAGF